MSALEMEAGVARQFAARSVTSAAGARGPEIRDVLMTIYGAVDGNPLRADFHGPKGVSDGSYIVLIFDLRTKNEVGNSSSSISFDRALDRMDWRNVIGALTH